MKEDVYWALFFGAFTLGIEITVAILSHFSGALHYSGGTFLGLVLLMIFSPIIVIKYSYDFMVPPDWLKEPEKKKKYPRPGVEQYSVKVGKR